MEFITFTLAMLDFIAYISKKTIRDQSFFQYWNCHIMKTAYPTVQHKKYSEA